MFKKLMAGVLLASLAITAIAPVASAAESKGQIKSNKNAVERIVGYSANNNDRLDTLIAAVTCEAFEGTVVDLLATTDGITIFAPTNYAFRKLGRALGIKGGLTPENVCTVDSETLSTILTYHVFDGGKVWYKQAKALRGNNVPMLSDELARISGQKDRVRIDGAKVVVKNIRSSNALIHVIDEVMVPPSIENA